MSSDNNKAALQSKPAPSDYQNQPGDYASSLQGGLPMRKRRYSPFDRIGSREFSNQKGKLAEAYTGKS